MHFKVNMKEVQSGNFNLSNAQWNLMDELRDSCHKNSFKKSRSSWNLEVRNANNWLALLGYFI